MSFFQRPRKSWPYAVNSTGRPRGSLNLGFAVGRVQVYEAVGDARIIFMDKLCPEVVNHLNDNNDKLPESGTFVDLSLFMIGKSLHQTKPMVMIVSNDKNARLEAFKMLKKSNILESYPGFALGHMDLRAEFENLQPLAEYLGDVEDATAELTSFTSLIDLEAQTPEVAPMVRTNMISTVRPETSAPTQKHVYADRGELWEGKRLLFQDSNGENLETRQARTATAGGVISYEGKYMLHTVNHFLERIDRETPTTSSPTKGNDIDDCEVTGMSDFEDDDYDDDDDDLAEITSRESMTPQATSSEDTPSQTNDVEMASIFSRATEQEDFVASITRELEGLAPKDSQLPVLPEEVVNVGQVTVSSSSLDSALIGLDNEYEFGVTTESKLPLTLHAIPLENYLEHIETAPRDAAIRTITPGRGTIRGFMCGTSSFVRLPRSKTFQEVYVGKLDRPLLTGDCGSWIRDASSGKLYGHVIAGSPTTGLILLIPARHSLAEALTSLSTDPKTWPDLVDLSLQPSYEDFPWRDFPMSSSSAKDPKRKRKFFWTCYKCSMSPMDVGIHASCFHCGHIRCGQDSVWSASFLDR